MNKFEHSFMSEVVWNNTLHLNYVMGVWHGWQLGLVAIYLVYAIKPQMVVGWLYGHMWGMPFTLSTRAMMYYDRDFLHIFIG